MKRSIASVVMLLMGCTIVSAPAQEQSRPVTNVLHFPAVPTNGNFAAAMPPTTPKPFIAPLYIENQETHSSLILVNSSTIGPAGATVSIRAMSGSVLSSRHVQLQPQERLELPISRLMPANIAEPELGSISVLQDIELKGLVVLGQLVITDETNATHSYLDEELAMPMAMDSPFLRGVTDTSNSPPLVAVTSASPQQQHVLMQCYGEKGAVENVSYMLPPFATRLASGCSDATFATIGAFLNGNVQAQASVTGIQIHSDQGGGALAAFAVSAHHLRDRTVLGAVNFIDPQQVHSPSAVYTGLPIGPQQVLSDGIYSPVLSVANFSVQPAHVHIDVYTSAPRSLETADDSPVEPESVAGHDLIVPPLKSTSLSLPAGSMSGLLHSLVVTSDRQPGEVVTKLVARGDGTLFQVEMLGKDALQLENAGGHPWTLGGDEQATVLLFNHEGKPAKVTVHVASGTSAWEREIVLSARETRAISINELIDSRISDAAKHVLLKGSRAGIVTWATPDAGHVTGRLMVSSKLTSMARSFSCDNYINVCGDNLFVYSGGSIPINYFAEYASNAASFCANWGPGQCGGNPTGSGSASYSWNVAPTNIVRFNTPSDQSAQGTHLYGVSGGAGSASSSACGGGCCASGGGSPPPIVQVPTADRIVSTDQSYALAVNQTPCGANQSGWFRHVIKINTDQQAPPHDIVYAGQSMVENVTIGSPNGLNVTKVNQATATTNNNGQYGDTYYVCSPVCPSSNYTIANQAITDNWQGSAFHWNNTLKYTCTGTTENGH